MPKDLPKRVEHCVVCGGHHAEVGVLSRRGLCEACGVRRQNEAALQMARKEGAAWEKWLASNATKEASAV